MMGAVDAMEFSPLILAHRSQKRMSGKWPERLGPLGDCIAQLFKLAPRVGIGGRKQARVRCLQASREPARVEELFAKRLRYWPSVRIRTAAARDPDRGRQMMEDLPKRSLAHRGMAGQKPFHVGDDLLQTVEGEDPSLGHDVISG